MRLRSVGTLCYLTLGISSVSSFSGTWSQTKQRKACRSFTAASRHQVRSSHILLLRAQQQKEATSSTKQPLGRKQGVYTRPSGAIERGSGFYFPGLEGPKVRLAFGSVLLAAIAVNHIISEEASSLLEVLSTVYAVLVLLQGIVQFRREENARNVLLEAEEDGSAMASVEVSSGNTKQGFGKKVLSYEQIWSVPIQNEDWRQTVEWAAATFTALTPATHFVILAKESNIFSFGRTPVAATLCEAASSTIAQSKTGRLSLPQTHPVSQQLEERYRTTIILQRVTENLCLVIASDQLLAAFSSTDLEWLGRLAKLLAVDAE